MCPQTLRVLQFIASIICSLPEDRTIIFAKELSEKRWALLYQYGAWWCCIYSIISVFRWLYAKGSRGDFPLAQQFQANLPYQSNIKDHRRCSQKKKSQTIPSRKDYLASCARTSSCYSPLEHHAEDMPAYAFSSKGICWKSETTAGSTYCLLLKRRNQAHSNRDREDTTQSASRAASSKTDGRH